MPELKEVADKIQNTWEQMKAKNDEVLAENKKMSDARAEDKVALGKMSNAIDEQKKQLDAIGLKIERQAVIKPGETQSEEQKAKKAAFYKWVRGGRLALEPAERKALVEDTAGLYLVPEELETEIIRAVPQINTLRNYCRIRPTSRDKVRVRSLTEVTVGWGKLETGAEIPESTQVPTSDYIYVEDLYGLSKIGEDELQDSDANLQSLLADSFAVAIANEEAKRFAIGRGHTSYNEPAGVAVDTTILASYKTDLASADALTPDDMLKAEYYLPAQYLNGSAWLLNRKSELEVRLVKAATTGNYLWQPALMAGQPNNFDGFPIINQNDMHYPDDATDGINVIFGNFRLGYMIVDRAGIAIQRLDELYAEAGLVGFKVHKRTGGGVYRPAAFWGLYNES
jgi:HK97 family phage major capsid protein